MIDITGFCHADNRMDQQVGLCLFGGAERQFLMRPMQRIASLKRNHFAPAKFAEIGPQFIWRIASAAKIIMHRWLDTYHWPTEINRPSLMM